MDFLPLWKRLQDLEILHRRRRRSQSRRSGSVNEETVAFVPCK